MKKTKLLIPVLLLLSLLVHGQSKNNSKSNSKWKNVTKNGFSVQYPGDWELDKSGQMGTSFIIFSPIISPKDQFRENVNLLIQNLKGMNIDLDKYVEISEEQIKKMITNAKIKVSKRQNINGSNYHKIIYTGNQEPYKLKFEQYYWVKNEKAYVLTLTCEANQFDSYKEIGEKILNSAILK